MRCGETAVLRFRGPCERCRDELYAKYPGVARTDVATAEYDPKMNVTPNAVATKD
jgi:hypothetical protein